jgi:adenosine deaminase
LHAGETQGPESVWQALEVANSLRIGHGVRSIEDPKLVAHLREKQIPLEVCPTSNVCLKVYPSILEHCLPQLLKEGLYITINSDDPPMFNTTLTNEFIQLEKHFGWDSEQLEKLTMNAIRASLLTDSRKQEMLTSFQSEFARLRSQYLG